MDTFPASCQTLTHGWQVLPLGMREHQMNRKIKSAIAAVAVALALLGSGGTGMVSVAEARGPLFCC